MSDSIEYCDHCTTNVPCHMERKCLRPKQSPSDMGAVDLIKYLNGRRGWHGSQYRSMCGEWLRKADIKRQALRELAADSLHNAGAVTPGENEPEPVENRTDGTSTNR